MSASMAVDRYAVIGNPIAHSKSPDIHHRFAQQTAQSLSYERILAPLDGFAVTANQLAAAGYRGANVTVPFKLQAYQLAQQLTERARAAGAVNTLVFNGDAILGDNTDGAGLLRDIQHNLNVSLAYKRVLLLGAGGAAEGVLQPILQQHPENLVIANRSVDKAISMIQKATIADPARVVSVQAHSFEELNGQRFDVIINATSTGLTDTAIPLPPSIFAECTLAYDMMYGKRTPFMQLAEQHGARVVDGLGMLVEQAAEAFYVWRGIRPETVPVMAQLRACT